MPITLEIETDEGLLSVDVDNLGPDYEIDWFSAIMTCYPEVGGGVQVMAKISCANLTAPGDVRFRKAHTAAIEAAVASEILRQQECHAADVGESR